MFFRSLDFIIIYLFFEIRLIPTFFIVLYRGNNFRTTRCKTGFRNFTFCLRAHAADHKRSSFRGLLSSHKSFRLPSVPLFSFFAFVRTRTRYPRGTTVFKSSDVAGYLSSRLAGCLRGIRSIPPCEEIRKKSENTKKERERDF